MNKSLKKNIVVKLYLKQTNKNEKLIYFLIIKLNIKPTKKRIHYYMMYYIYLFINKKTNIFKAIT